MISPIKIRSRGLKKDARRVLFAIPAVFAATVPAFAGDPLADGDFDVRWDNTLTYTAAVRIVPRNAELTSNPNSDDGDRNFAPGLASNRLDLRSAIVISENDFGFEASLEAWYDTVYQIRTANNSPGTYNAISVPNTAFPRSVRALEGQYVDLTDTFAYGSFAMGDTPVTVRAGRETLLWGNSFFFDENSIASAQSPVDYWKVFFPSDGYADDVYLPVAQISATAQPRPDLAISAYYQFEWRHSRLAGVGSYFSTTDVLGTGAERLFLEPGEFLLHARDSAPGNGQFGVSVHKTMGALDLGLYALTYDAKYPELSIDAYASPPVYGGAVGTFHSVYPKDIQLYAASFSTYVGDSNLMGEIIGRRNAPLASYASSLAYPPISGSLAAAESYARGDTLHTDVSMGTTLSPWALWARADLNAEVAADYILDIGESARDPGVAEKRLVPSLRLLFEPHYFEVLPNLDLAVPIGLGLNELSQYGTNYTDRPGHGDLEAGVAATYHTVWKASFTITCFLGSPYRQPLADRDFVAFTLVRSF